MDAPSGAAVARWASLPSWLLTRAAGHAHRLVEEGFAAADARGYHYRLLATLQDHGPASQAELGRRSGIHLSDMVAAVSELAERGLVERAPDPADRRRNTVSLTPDGARQLRRLDARVAETQDELLAPLAPEDRRRLAELLAALVDHHEQQRGGAGGGPGPQHSGNPGSTGRP